jgi:unsaturated rhamnogalacturonyl hydrolase
MSDAQKHVLLLGMPMKLRISVIAVLLLMIMLQSCSDRDRTDYDSWSVRTIESFLTRYPDAIPYNAGRDEARWGYEQGVMLEAIRRVGEATGEQKYFDYIKQHLDGFINEDGTINTYVFESFNIDNIPPGRQLFWLYEETKDPKYRYAADTLRKQLTRHPRTESGGFWHKLIYPYQMWLDGIYMGEPFYAQYAAYFGETEAFDDIAHQIILIEEKTRDDETGLLYHAYDETRGQRWADPETGTSPHFWGRAMGWYAMGLVDVLDYFPADHPEHGTIVAILQRLSEALLNYQDRETGLWYQIVDLADREGNYLESSASAMYAYAFAKGVRLGYLDEGFLDAAHRAFDGLIEHKVTVDEEGLVDLHDGCAVAGLGGNPYRDGSFEYYISEPRRTNDFKAVGPFIFAALELGR